MITTVIVPMLTDGNVVALGQQITAHTDHIAQQITTVAAPIWDIGANFKDKGIKFATYILMGGIALVAAVTYFIMKDKTATMKAVAVGIVLIGIINALPSLGLMSTDTVKSVTNTGGYR